MNVLLAHHLNIRYNGKFFCKPDWYWHRDAGPDRDFNLWTVLDGHGRLQAPRQVYDLSAGDCFLLRGNEDYYGTMNGSEFMTIIYIHFDFLDLSGNIVRPASHQLPNLYRQLDHESFFFQLLERVIKLHACGKTGEASAWLRTALLEIGEQDERNTTTDSGIINFINDLCRKIRENPEKKYDLREISGKASCCPEHFSRLFKKIIGTSFRDCILDSRINAGKGLLTSTGYSVSRIADMLGYHDIFLFSRQFRQRTGQSPTEFRNRT